MKTIMYVIAGILGLIAFLTLIYILLLSKLRKINAKIYRYKQEKNFSKDNVLIVYQPSRHKTTNKIVDLIKEIISKKGYGYNIHTLTEELESYNEYKYVIFVAPVYFGEINQNFMRILSKVKIKNLLIVYNGLNSNSENEDVKAKQISLSKYKKIKVHTTDIDLVNEFINKEVL